MAEVGYVLSMALVIAGTALGAARLAERIAGAFADWMRPGGLWGWHFAYYFAAFMAVWLPPVLFVTFALVTP